jgi:predicted Zn finger-like uncharacterized protein
MKIVCPKCKTAYELAPVALGSAGRTVRCARCQSQWFAEAPKAVPLGSRPRPNFVPVPARQPTPENAVTAAGSLDIVAAPEAMVAPVEAVAPSPPPPPAKPVAPAVAAASAPPSAAESQNAATPPAGASTTESAADPAEAGATEEAAAPKVDIESLAARRLAKRRSPRKPTKSTFAISRIAAVLAALIAIDAGLLIWRTEVVRMLPQTASLYEYVGLPVNLRDLAFKDIHTTYDEQDGVTILVVQGSIIATGRSAVDVPRLRFAIQAANGHEIYAWTALPSRTKLAPGEALPFKSRLASPPEQGRSVKIRFFNRQDVASGLR